MSALQASDRFRDSSLSPDFKFSKLGMTFCLINKIELRSVISLTKSIDLLEGIKIELSLVGSVAKVCFSEGCYQSRRDYRLLTVTSISRRFWAVSSTCTGTTTTAGLVSSTCTGTTSSLVLVLVLVT